MISLQDRPSLKGSEMADRAAMQVNFLSGITQVVRLGPAKYDRMAIRAPRSGPGRLEYLTQSGAGFKRAPVSSWRERFLEGFRGFLFYRPPLNLDHLGAGDQVMERFPVGPQGEQAAELRVNPVTR